MTLRRVRFVFALVPLAVAACGSDPGAPRPTSPLDMADVVLVDHVEVDAGGADADGHDAPIADGRDAPIADASPDELPRVDASDASSDAPTVDAGGPACGAPDYACPAGYRCVGLATTRCVRTAAVGEACRNAGEASIFCEVGATCETLDGSPRCVALGARDGVCRNTNGCSPMCDPGLGCDSGLHCRPGLPPGALAGAPEDVCVDGTSRQDVGGTLRCVADGAPGGYCRPDRGCDAGLRCTGVNSGAAVGCNREYFHCVVGLQLGEDCTPGGLPCPGGSTCALTAGAMRCVEHPDGTVGGRCRGGSAPCDEGAQCGEGGWICERRVARGMRCEPPGGGTVCADDDGCSADHRGDEGRCVARGTAPGADCRTDGAPCDEGLACSTFSRYRRTCRRLARAGDACDLGAIQTICPDGTRCLPTSVDAEGTATARCAEGVAEVEPNERGVPARAVIERPVLYRASLGAADAEDCHAVRVAAGSALWVESSIPLVARLFRSSGLEIGRWTMAGAGGWGPLSDLARLDPGAIGVLRSLAADEYLLCVREPGGSTARATPIAYTLALAVLPRAW